MIRHKFLLFKFVPPNSAVGKYGEKAKAGVIEITLKNKEQD